jgi:predicted DCC family thiol-disulfide oxidoreductase YuxK
MCDRSVRLLHRLDRRGRLWFAPLQGETARALGIAVDVSETGTIQLVFEAGGVVRAQFERSAAILRTLRIIGGFWGGVATLGWLVPRGLRDAGYRAIARRRQAWSAKLGACGLPAAGLRDRLLP